MECYEQALKLKPDYKTVCNNLAWTYATCDDPSLYNPPRALELALKAIKLDKNASCLDTLAVAYAANGNFEQAIKTQQQAIELTENQQYKEAWLRQIQGYKNAKDYRQQQ